MTTRTDLLNSLLDFNQPLSEIVPLLNSFNWDSQTALITLKQAHIIAILNRYLLNELSAADVEDWANAIEGREDIKYDDNFDEILDEVMYELANPLLAEPLSLHLAQKWIEKLSSSTISV